MDFSKQSVFFFSELSDIFDSAKNAPLKFLMKPGPDLYHSSGVSQVCQRRQEFPLEAGARRAVQTQSRAPQPQGGSGQEGNKMGRVSSEAEESYQSPRDAESGAQGASGETREGSEEGRFYISS